MTCNFILKPHFLSQASSDQCLQIKSVCVVTPIMIHACESVGY